MGSRFYQLQHNAAYSDPPSRSSSSRPRPRPQPQPHAIPTYSQRASTSSASSASSGASSSSSSYHNDPYGPSYSEASASASASQQPAPRVETLRCSRCATCVEAVVSRAAAHEQRKVSAEDATASGMVRFGHNLYYCERCAEIVGYK